MDKKQLWLNLKAYHFDNLVAPDLWDHIQEKFSGTNASTKAFADKLARKLEWKNKFALKAIDEYKKFVYLGVISEFAATPSKVIDKVWHEHILFSKAYREFCINVIHYDFDHTPELVPMADQTGTFNAQYLDTLQLYKSEFGVDPPGAIWSIPKFDKEVIPANGYEAKKKRSSSTYIDDAPLHSWFVASTGSEESNSFPEFSGFDGGSGGGAGTSGAWDSPGTNDNGSGSSDSGSGCSSCSSGGGD